MNQDSRAATAIDPVCGMTIEIDDAKANQRATEYEGKAYYFCSRGCLLDFEEGPGRYLDPGYAPSM